MKSDYQGIWVFAEQENGKLHPTVLELLAKSKELQKHNGEKITAVLLGADVSALADTVRASETDLRTVPTSRAIPHVQNKDKAIIQLTMRFNMIRSS